MNSKAGWHKTDDWETERLKKQENKEGKNVRDPGETGTRQWMNTLTDCQEEYRRRNQNDLDF